MTEKVNTKHFFPFERITNLKTPTWVSLMVQMVKNLPAVRKARFDSWVRKIPWRRKGQPAPVFLPGKSHGKRRPEATVHAVTKRHD